MNRHEQGSNCNIADTDRGRFSPSSDRALTAIGPLARRSGPGRRGGADATRATHTDHSPLATPIEGDTRGCAEPCSNGAEAGHGDLDRSKRLLILATGDDRLRSTGQDYLRDHGYAVGTASGGLECVAMLRVLVPEAVILDADLLWGGADGVLACLRPGSRSRIPFVYLAPSAGGMPDCEKGDDSPVVSVLQKPVTLSSLLRAVRSAAGRGISIGGGN
jgi:hypothetical protein